jgi:pyridoxamine 5'-phosphate oxidase
MILVQNVADDGLIFCTDSRSRKISELNRNAYAAGVCYWHALNRQLRVEGTIEEAPASFAEDDFETKSDEQKLAISMCSQSEPISRYWRLERDFELRARQAKIGSRPDYWRAYLLNIDLVEFLKGGAGRLNKRVVFRRVGDKWHSSRLFP